MTIRERDQALDREYISKTGHSIHEARWALNPSYDPDLPIPWEPSPMAGVLAHLIMGAVFIGLVIWFTR